MQERPVVRNGGVPPSTCAAGLKIPEKMACTTARSGYLEINRCGKSFSTPIKVELERNRANETFLNTSANVLTRVKVKVS